jgi:hypothetical protein
MALSERTEKWLAENRARLDRDALEEIGTLLAKARDTTMVNPDVFIDQIEDVLHQRGVDMIP